MSLRWEAKDPDDIANYAVDWTTELGGDTISTSTFSLAVAAGLTIVSQGHSPSSATIVLSGGTAGNVATLLNRITTGTGNQFDVEIILEVAAGLVLEDGTGKPNCETYASLAMAAVYCAKHGLAWSGTIAEQEAALRRGFDWLNRLSWQGVRVHGRAQYGSWPRGGAIDSEFWPILFNEIPHEIIEANIELAVYELANPGGLVPIIIPREQIESLRETIGPITTQTTYINTIPNGQTSKPVIPRVDALIAPFMVGDPSVGGLCGRAERA